MVLTLCYSARVDQTSTEKLVDELERDLIKKTEELEIVKDKLSDRELEVVNYNQMSKVPSSLMFKISSL